MIFNNIIKMSNVHNITFHLDDLRSLGSHYMCDFAQGKCNWTASAGKMKWIEAQVGQKILSYNQIRIPFQK